MTDRVVYLCGFYDEEAGMCAQPATHQVLWKPEQQSPPSFACAAHLSALRGSEANEHIRLTRRLDAQS